MVEHQLPTTNPKWRIISSAIGPPTQFRARLADSSFLLESPRICETTCCILLRLRNISSVSTALAPALLSLSTTSFKSGLQIQLENIIHQFGYGNDQTHEGSVSTQCNSSDNLHHHQNIKTTPTSLTDLE